LLTHFEPVPAKGINDTAEGTTPYRISNSSWPRRWHRGRFSRCPGYGSSIHLAIGG